MNIITNKLKDWKACSEYAKYASKGYEIIECYMWQTCLFFWGTCNKLVKFIIIDLLQDNILVKLHLKWSNQQIQSTPIFFF